MGFGHRVYRAEDPRARVLRATAKRLEAPRYEVAAALEQAALAELRERRPDRAIETNVEFWAAVILDFAQVPTQMMPAMFTCGRTAGWCAHILEQKRLGKLVRPAAIYVGPRPPKPRVRRGLGPRFAVVTTEPFDVGGDEFRRTGARDSGRRLGRTRPGRLGPSLAGRPCVPITDHGAAPICRPPPSARTSPRRRSTTCGSTRRRWGSTPRMSPSAAGRQAGTSATIRPPRSMTLVSRVLAAISHRVDDPLIKVIGGLGIRLHTYLPTRTFELAVHGTRYCQGAWHSAPAAGRRARRGDWTLATRTAARDRTRRVGAPGADGSRHAYLRRSRWSDSAKFDHNTCDTPK